DACGIADLGVERYVPRSAAAAVRATLAHEVDDHRTHHVAGVAQEVFAVADVQTPGGREAQVGLVHQGRRVQNGVRSGAPQSRASLDTQFLVGGVEDHLQRGFVASLGEAE